MPRLPSEQDLGQRPVPSSGGGVAQLQLTTPRMGAEAQAFTELGQATSGLGKTFAVLAEKEKQRVDDSTKEDAYTNYQQELLELELDQEKGYQNVLAGEAVRRPLVEEYQQKREAIRNRLRDELANDEQRTGFDKRTRVADSQFDSRLYQHVATQTRAYHEAVSESVIETERQMAAVNWDQPGQIELSILRTEMELERRAEISGLDRGNPDDKRIIDTQKRIAETQIHANVVAQMLSQGNDAAAKGYYEQVRNDLTPEAIATLGAKVNEATADNEAIRAADTAWATMGPETINDPVRLSNMDSWLRQQYKDKPEVMEAALKDLRSRATAHDDQQRQLSASNQAEVLQAFHDGASLPQLQLMPEYQLLSGEDKTKLREYVTKIGWTEQQRARAALEYQDGDKARASFAHYWELSNPRRLATLSEPEILALEPELGQEQTASLIKAKRALVDSGSVHAATIDAELFNLLASEAGLSPYKARQTEEEKEYLGRLKNQVETLIDIAQQDKGGKLTRSEKETIMRAEIDKKVMLDEWGSDPALPAAVVRPEQRESMYVPIRQIDPNWLKGAVNYIRSTEGIPQDWSDERIQSAFRGRFERAYAHSISGGAAAEGKALLDGE